MIFMRLDRNLKYFWSSRGKPNGNMWGVQVKDKRRRIYHIQLALSRKVLHSGRLAWVSIPLNSIADHPSLWLGCKKLPRWPAHLLITSRVIYFSNALLCLCNNKTVSHWQRSSHIICTNVPTFPAHCRYQMWSGYKILSTRIDCVCVCHIVMCVFKRRSWQHFMLG